MLFTLLLGLVLICVPGTVQAGDGHGHRAISEAVQATLDPPTVQTLARIAGTGDELPPGFLARLSLWPDEIRPLVNNWTPHTVTQHHRLRYSMTVYYRKACTRWTRGTDASAACSTMVRQSKAKRSSSVVGSVEDGGQVFPRQSAVKLGW